MAPLHLVVDDLRIKIRCRQKEGVTLIATLLGFTRFLCEYGGSGFSNPILLTTFFMRKLAYALGESLSQAVVCFNWDQLMWHNIIQILTVFCGTYNIM